MIFDFSIVIVYFYTTDNVWIQFKDSGKIHAIKFDKSVS